MNAMQVSNIPQTTFGEYDDELDPPRKSCSCEKITQIASRAFSSPLYWIVGSLAAPVSSTIKLGTAALIGCWYYKRVFYDAALLSIILINKYDSSMWPWWNKIDENVLVGAIPLSNENHAEMLKNERVTGVLTLLEPFEIETVGVLSDPVSKEDWEKYDIEHKFIEIGDLQPLTMELIAEGVAFIKKHADANGLVYVHCKAGQGRSVSMVICYLLQHGGFDDIDKAIQFVAAKRAQIYLTAKQLEMISKYFDAAFGSEKRCYG